jgi:hypothetical protein
MAWEIAQVTMAVFMIILGIVATFESSHRAHDASRAAEDGAEVELRIVTVAVLETEFRYRYHVPGEPETKTRTVLVPKDKPPLLLDKDAHFMLGLRSPRNRGRIVVLGADLAPFAFTPDEQQTIRNLLEARLASASEA